jgi:hypothetical protein
MLAVVSCVSRRLLMQGSMTGHATHCPGASLLPGCAHPVAAPEQSALCLATCGGRAPARRLPPILPLR